MTHAGGWSQAEPRLGEVAAILMIKPRRKAMYAWQFQKLRRRHHDRHEYEGGPRDQLHHTMTLSPSLGEAEKPMVRPRRATG
jgi:hypothetical protein